MKWILVIISTWSIMSAKALESKTLEWDFFHPVRKEWMPLGEKGSVQEALIAAGELPDPFYGTNESKFEWVEEHVWEFKSILMLTEEDLKHNYLELEFGSIDTFGEVSINGEPFLSAKNAFIPHRKQAKELLKVGVNEITVLIAPPVLYHADMWKNKDYQLPAPNDVHDVAVAPYTRKPQYQFGWDWALRMNTIGFNKPAVLYLYVENRLINKTIEILEVNENEASIKFSVQLINKEMDSLEWESVTFGNETVAIEDGWASRIVSVKNPELWWPLGQGSQYLYYDLIKLNSESNQIASFGWQFGIKTSELVQEKDEWGTSYYFKINGRKIFSKGGDYIPQDIFPARVKDEDIVSILETMAESNFNMVRVWGGGYYPDDIFFETCDRLGLMIWEDLMFACAMYPGDDEFIANISEEFEYQIPRIAGHPSVVQFNGNNEVEVAWGNWGFQIKYGLYGKSAKEIEEAYDRVFKQAAPEIINKYTNIPYIHTSPLSNWGKMDYYNHGSQHYWGVWHGKDPIEDFGKKIGRFNAEYGFQSFPEYSTLLTFSDTTQWDLNSEVMKHHQKSYVGNNMILKHAKNLYGEPKDFGDFVYYSQLTQAMAVSMAVAGHRVDYPRCGGTLYWQVNDCWPAPTWSSLDYYGNWKALQYRIKDDYKEVAVVEKYHDLETVDYYLVSGVVDTFECTIHLIIQDEKGEVLYDKEWRETVNGQENKLLLSHDVLSQWKSKNIRINFNWNSEMSENKLRSFDRFNSNRKVPECEDISLSIIDHDSESGVMKVQVTTTKYLQDFWLYCNVPGVKFDRNFVSLLPGEHIFILESPNLSEDTKFEMRWH